MKNIHESNENVYTYIRHYFSNKNQIKKKKPTFDGLKRKKFLSFKKYYKRFINKK